MNIQTPYLLFIGDSEQAKTAQGVRDWRPEVCLGQLRFPGNPIDLGVPDMTLEEAVSAGARTLLIGVAVPGGKLPKHWIATLTRALEVGLDVASGLHVRLNGMTELKAVAERYGRMIFDVRHPTQEFEIGAFEFRPGKRLLTVGTDCAVGKKYTALALEREMKARGMKADFRATGQTGILITGRGVSVDAVVADFIAAAAAWLSPANDSDHWDLIEGQGSLFHPAYAGVTLGLVHGSQPDALVLCSDPTRETLSYFDRYSQPSLSDCIDAYTRAARLTNPNAKVVGISLNTAKFGRDEALSLIDKVGREFGLPCVDPFRTGVGPIVDSLQALAPV